ncbi:unnamed protein product [Arctogadus glacialis]
MGSPNPIPALWYSTQSITLVGVVKQRGDVVWGQEMKMNWSYNSQVAGTPRFLPSGCSKTNPGSLVQSDHASFTEASGQKGPTKGSLWDIMSEGESFGHEPTAKRKRALVIHHCRQCRSQTLARSLKTHLTNISSV